jgi:hypothetical protein
VSAALIVSSIASLIQIIQIPIPFTRLVIGESFRFSPPPPFFSLNHSGEKSNPFAYVHYEIDVGQQILTQNSNPSMSKVHAHHHTLCGFSRTLEFSFCRFFFLQNMKKQQKTRLTQEGLCAWNEVGDT